jgi:hypothetical protein
MHLRIRCDVISLHHIIQFEPLTEPKLKNILWIENENWNNKLKIALNIDNFGKFWYPNRGHDSQHSDTQLAYLLHSAWRTRYHILSYSGVFLLCWVSLKLMLKCLVSLYWMPLSWVSVRWLSLRWASFTSTVNQVITSLCKTDSKRPYL